MGDEKPTLVESLHNKYGCTDVPIHCDIRISKGAPGKNDSGQLVLPTFPGMEGLQICRVGDEEEMRGLCQHVTELDLSRNQFSDWREVLSILRSIPNLQFLNLSYNPLHEGGSLTDVTATLSRDVQFTSLTRLVVNGTLLSWETIWELLHRLPSVTELHVSMNNISHIKLPPDGIVYPKVKTLFLNGNKISDCEEIVKISQLFPAVERLAMIYNPFKSLPTDKDLCGEDKNLCGEDNDLCGEDKNLAGDDKNICDDDKDLCGEDKNLCGDDNDLCGDDKDICGKDKNFCGDDKDLCGEDKNLCDYDKDICGKDENLCGEDKGEDKNLCGGDQGLCGDKKLCGDDKDLCGDDKDLCGGDKDLCGVCFPHLSCLNIEKCLIDSWSVLETLRYWPRLTDLRMRGLPLLEQYDEDTRRNLTLSYLPNIKHLNGSKICQSEMVDAERAFIRHYMHEETKPNRYHELHAVHGDLQPLVTVDLKPKHSVTVAIHYNGKSGLKTFNIHSTLRQVKVKLAPFVGKPARSLVIVHRDIGAPGGDDQMLYNDRTLARYHVKDGDELFVELK